MNEIVNKLSVLHHVSPLVAFLSTEACILATTALSGLWDCLSARFWVTHLLVLAICAYVLITLH